MTLLGFTGILLGLLFGLFAMIERTRLRLGIFAGLYVVHLVSTGIYYAYVQSAGGDSELYYLDYLGWYQGDFNFGTVFLIWVVQATKDALGGTYLDYFLLFQAIGFGGVAALMRIFEETYAELETHQPGWTYLLLFMPSLMFWTSALGKDAPLFFACALIIWGMMSFTRRLPAIAIALVLMILIRPHVAVIAVVALAVTLVFERRFNLVIRAGLVAVALVGAWFAITTTASTSRLDLLSADSISEFVDARDNIANSASGGNTSVQGSFATRLVSLMARPIFIDAEDAFGYVASSENLLLVAIYMALLWQMRALIALFFSSAFIRFSLVFFVGLVVMLTLAYYNVGLGLRQRTMMLPALLTLFLTAMAVRRARERQLTVAWA